MDVEEILNRHFDDPPAAALDELRQVVSELGLRLRELEEENRQLRKTQQTLEAYRDRYTDLYDFAPLGYVTLDEDSYIQEINLAGARLLNADRDALTGYPLLDYVAAGDRDAFLNHVRTCVREHVEVTCEIGLLGKGGQAIAAHFHSIPLDELKSGAGLVKTAITDISARKRAEEALQEDRNLLRTLIDHLPDAIYVKDLQHRFVAVNATVANLMGTIPDALLGKTDEDFYPQELAAEFHRDEERVFREGQPLLGKLEPHFDTRGNPRSVVTTKLPLRDGRGAVVGLVGISRDITCLGHEQAASTAPHTAGGGKFQITNPESQTNPKTQ
jgi:PAS domain S-box-containing protein